MLDSGSALTVGQIVPDYELLRRIGGGAYGEVWLARSKATGVLRAAKIVWRHTFEDERPFQREFEGIQRFERVSREHPSQLSLFHIGRNDAEGYFYYVMELADDAATAADYVPRTLRADLNKGRLPAAQALEVALALTEALGHLHQNGLVHRDVKPSNVIFVNGRPKLADIGLVTDASDTRSIVGTEGYLPREGPGTPQADIFALGKVLYEAVTDLDRREFPKLPDDLRDWPDRNAVVEINEVVLKACAADSEERYKSCGELQTELTLLRQGESIRLKRGKKRRLASSRKIAVALAVVALVAVNFAFWEGQFGSSARSADGPPSTNMEANALCEKAIYILRGDNYREIGAAYTNFHEAIKLDPNFARPYVGLLELEVREDVHVPGFPRSSVEDLRAITDYLKRLAPHLAPTYCAQSVESWSDWNYPEAERFAREAIKADPNYEFGHSWYCWLLYCFGRVEESRGEREMAMKLAPSKSIMYRVFGNAELAARRYTNAIEWYRQAIQWEPHHYVPYEGIGKALQALGDYTNALGFQETNEILYGAEEAQTRRKYAELRHALDSGGILGYWDEEWKRARANTNGGFYEKARIQIHLGNTNEALGLLEKSYAVHERNGFASSLNCLLYDESWDGLHDNKRFKRLLDEIGFTKVMPQRNK
jgi:serine/threonine protein kinase